MSTPIVNQHNGYKQWFLLSIFLTLLTGCNHPWIDPVYKDQVSPDPGKPWEPESNEWYCPRPEKRSPVSSLVVPTLNDEFDIAGLLNIALSNHPQTKLAWAQARAQAFAVGAAESAYYPTLVGSQSLVFTDFTTGALTGSGSSGTNPGTGTITTLDGNTIPRSDTAGARTAGFTTSIVTQLSLSYLILDFGGRDATVQATKYALQSLDWTQNRVIQQVIYNVIQSYYNYVDAKELLQAKKDDLKNAQTNLDSAQALYKSGIVRKLDLLQAEANVQNGLLNVVNAESQLKINLGVLAVALGIPPSTEFEAMDLPEHFPVEEVVTNVDKLMDLARANRPDLAAAYAVIRENQMNYKVALSASLPTLNATGNTQWVSFLHPHNTPNGHFYTGAISVNVPIFNGFLYENQMRQAQENIRAAKASFENLENTALLDVITSYYNFISAKEAMQYSESYLAFAQEAYDVSLGTYKTGTGSMIDLLAAVSVLSNARAQRIDARTKWAISLFAISYATGLLDVSVVQEKEGKGCI